MWHIHGWTSSNSEQPEIPVVLKDVLAAAS